jgi:hypothetical protein
MVVFEPIDSTDGPLDQGTHSNSVTSPAVWDNLRKHSAEEERRLEVAIRLGEEKPAVVREVEETTAP